MAIRLSIRPANLLSGGLRQFNICPPMFDLGRITDTRATVRMECNVIPEGPKRSFFFWGREGFHHIWALRFVFLFGIYTEHSWIFENEWEPKTTTLGKTLFDVVSSVLQLVSYVQGFKLNAVCLLFTRDLKYPCLLFSPFYTLIILHETLRSIPGLNVSYILSRPMWRQIPH